MKAVVAAGVIRPDLTRLEYAPLRGTDRVYARSLVTAPSARPAGTVVTDAVFADVAAASANPAFDQALQAARKALLRGDLERAERFLIAADRRSS